jgi:hypothetical protein
MKRLKRFVVLVFTVLAIIWFISPIPEFTILFFVFLSWIGIRGFSFPLWWFTFPMIGIVISFLTFRKVNIYNKICAVRGKKGRKHR